MSKAIEGYLDKVFAHANRTPEDELRLREELEDHLLTKAKDLERTGVAREDAVCFAIEDHGAPDVVGYGLREKFPWLDVRSKGTARGVIAVGPKAVGIIAIGGASFGVFAFGGFASGLITMGGFSAALLLAMGGFAVAPVGLAWGGMAAGLLALGGTAIGVVAFGGQALGVWVASDQPGAISYFEPGQLPGFLEQFTQGATLTLPEAMVFANWFFRAFLVLMTISLAAQLYLVHHENRRIRRRLE